MLESLDLLQKWPDTVKEAQRGWIGRSDGALISFGLGASGSIEVFTTRADVLAGVSFIAVSDEQESVLSQFNQIDGFNELLEAHRLQKRPAAQGEIDYSGFQIPGLFATNPLTYEQIPVFVAAYVQADYGCGAVMGVPAHNDKDLKFAAQFGLPTRNVFCEETNTVQGT